METEKRLIDANAPISEGDVFYIIAKYNLSRWEAPIVAEVEVAYKQHNRFYAYDRKGVGTFSFTKKQVGICAFKTREEAEAKLAELLMMQYKAGWEVNEVV